MSAAFALRRVADVGDLSRGPASVGTAIRKSQTFSVDMTVTFVNIISIIARRPQPRCRTRKASPLMPAQNAGLFSAIEPPRRRKRSDLIAHEIKRWAVREQLSAGDKLPNEAQLAKAFACGKGTVREALKSLEVQGLVRMHAGPHGGPVMTEASYERAAEQLRSFLHFKTLSIDDIYAARIVAEVEMAAACVGRIDEEGFALLESRLSEGGKAAPRRAGLRTLVRRSELDFHFILSEYCPNPLLAFQSRFLADLLRDFIEFDGEDQDDFDCFTHDNHQFHAGLVAAFRAEDEPAVRRLMTEHMRSAHVHTRKLFARIAPSLLLQEADAS